MPSRMYLGRSGCGKVESPSELLFGADGTDIGYQGMVYVNEDTPYMRLLKPFIEKKKVCTARKRLADM
jgi:hypothetical protein